MYGARPELSVVVVSMGEDQRWRAASASLRASAAGCATSVQIVLVWQGADPPAAADDVDVVHVEAINLSYARNRGARHAGASLVAFVDDDEIVDPRFSGEAVTALREADAAFGPIDPLDAAGRPHCLTDHGAARIFDAWTPPWEVGSGGNMAFRRDVLLGLGGFDLRFGAGGSGRSAEETDLIWRLQADGRLLRWCPDMIVHHPTKNDAEILASRRPYGYGAGRLLRRARSPLLLTRYGHAVAQSHLQAVARTDRRGLQEASVFAGGLVAGLSTAPPRDAPELNRKRLPAAIVRKLHAGQALGLPTAASDRPHLAWEIGDQVLHLHADPTVEHLAAVTARERWGALAGVPALLAHERPADGLWLLEERLVGDRPLDRPEGWWAGASDMVIAWGAAGGIGSAGSARECQLARGGLVPRALRPPLADALARLADHPAGVARGALAVCDLVEGSAGLSATGWATCTDTGLPGADLLELALDVAGGADERRALVVGLLAGKNPQWGDVLGPLTRLAAFPDILADVVLVLLVARAERECIQIPRPRTAPRRHDADLLAALSPLWSRR